MAITGISQIDTHVPFGSHISSWLRYANCRSFETFVRLADQYEQHYLAWEQVREGGNPFLENGTGFEGYFVGTCFSPEEALQSVLRVGQTILTNLITLHRYDHQFHARLMNALTDQVFDLRALSEWAAEFGAELARLRCKALLNPQAQAFRTELYHTVDRLPHIVYAGCDSTIKQRYAVVVHCVQSSRINVNVSLLSPSQQDAWQVVQRIGKLGHPLLREFMDLRM